jgi:hypothetical protein
MPRLNSDTTARPPYSQCCAIKSKECRDSKPHFGWHSRWRTAACITTLACMCGSTGVDSRGRFSNEPRLHKTKNYIGVLLQCDAAPEHSKRLATPCLPPRASHPEPFEGKKTMLSRAGMPRTNTADCNLANGMQTQKCSAAGMGSGSAWNGEHHVAQHCGHCIGVTHQAQHNDATRLSKCFVSRTVTSNTPYHPPFWPGVGHHAEGNTQDTKSPSQWSSSCGARTQSTCRTMTCTMHRLQCGAPAPAK